MFYIKSDDMEELFREAAEKYHIDTTGAEAWNDVRAAVHADDVQPRPTPPEDKRKRKWFVLGWLLLVPLGWFAHNAWTNMRETQAGQLAKQPAKTTLADNIAKTKTALQAQETQNVHDNKQTAVATYTAKELQINKNEKPPIAGTGAPFMVKQADNAVRVMQGGTTAYNIETKPAGNPPGAGMENYGKVEGTNMQNKAALTSENNVNAALPAGNDVSKTNHAQGKPVLPLPTMPAGGNNSQTVPNQLATKLEDAPGDKQGSDAINKSATKKQGQKTAGSHYFYAGLSAAPDVSFVHFQKTSTMGTGAGILLGYHINKNISIESGVSVEKKYYYTSGEYFDLSKIPYFAANNIQLKSATGNCNMIEIPLNLRYTFITKGKNSFYALGGISSYVMGHEDYTFNYNDWGIPTKSTWAYNNTTDYWFSILNLGAGYERKLGSKTNIRIEPYMKLPLSGLGTGNLKIASAGLYFTLARKLP